MNFNPFYTLLTQPLANGLALFYRLFAGNLGLAIIGFSIFLRIILTPLTKPYMESMKKMKDYAKDIEKIKAKHKGDKAKETQAIAEFYKTKGIKPGAGCLPYILQIVILIAFFRVFTTVLNGDNIAASFNSLLYAPLKFAEGTVINTRFLYMDLVKPDVFHFSGIPFPIPGIALLLSAVAQFLGAKLNQPAMAEDREAAAGTKGPGDDMAVAMQNSMIYTFPIITILAGIRFPSGLALYWFVISVFQVVSQMDRKAFLSKLGLVKSEAR